MVTRFLINPSVSFTCQLEVDFEVDKKGVTKEEEIELLLVEEFGNEKAFDKTDCVVSTSYKHKHFYIQW